MHRIELSNTEVMVLAVHRLGGILTGQDTEDIAMEADRIAPGRFRWRKYPQFISDELIRVFLSDAKKQKNGGLLAGDGTRGWRLTVAGAKLAASLADYDRAPARPRKDRELEKRIRLEVARLLDSSAWHKHSKGEPVSLRDAESVFRVGDYTKPDRRDGMVERLRLLFLDDPQFGPFIEDMTRLVRLKGAKE